MRIILVDGLGNFVERDIPFFVMRYQSVRHRARIEWFFGRAFLSVPREPDVVTFEFAREVDCFGRYVYRQMGVPPVLIRYPRTEPDDDMDRALDTIIAHEREKAINRGLNDLLGGLDGD
jgi:hypothetical protein